MAASQTSAETDPAATGLLIFDGDCGFCTTAARSFAHRVNGSVRIVASQQIDPTDYGLTDQDVASAVYWVAHGHAYAGADAVAHALAAGDRPWSWVGRALRVPPLRWLARALYPVIARHRHRLPGATAACRLDGS